MPTRILYGIVGEGMGHATRSRVVLEHLLGQGIEVMVVVSGKAHRFLLERFAGRQGIEIEEIHGLTMSFEGNALDLSETIATNLEGAPDGLRKNVDVYHKVIKGRFEPHLVISDFESWAYLYALNHRLPLISIDNMQIINRCEHDDEIKLGVKRDFFTAKTFIKMKLPGAYHYLVSSFFFPKVRKKRTSLVPPILRPEVIAAQREPQEHVIVYPSNAWRDRAVEMLQGLPYEFRIYGMGQEGRRGNVTMRPFSETGFIDDLRTAKAVIAGGGFSLMSEAVHLHVPMLSWPIEKQFEQVLNARYLEKLGYGLEATEINTDIIEHFLARTDDFSQALERYPSQDNTMLFRNLNEILRHIALSEPPPDRLEAESMGKYYAPF